MYKILGGDGREYGPVSAETLRQWIAEGRANADTRVQPEGGTEWQPLSMFPEFDDLTGGPAPAPAMEMPAGAAPMESPEDRALALATPAGWALMIVGILAMLMSIGLIIYYAVHGVPKNPFEDLFPHRASPEATRVAQKVGTFAAMVVSVGWAAFVTFAGVKLRRLESWGLVLTGAILAIIPCCGSQFPMCILSAPIGIWVIIVICQRKVKSAFT